MRSPQHVRVLSVTTTPSAWKGTSALAAGTSAFGTAIGLHPQLAQQRKGELAQFDELIHETRYVGEIGLDGTPECKPFWEDQLAVFEHVLQTCAAQEAAFSRYTAAELRKTYWFSSNAIGQPERRSSTGSRAVSQSGTGDSSRLLVQRGSRNAPRSQKGRDLVGRMPSDRVLTETDGPFAMFGDRADPAVGRRRRGEPARRGSGHCKLRKNVEERLAVNLRTLIGSTQRR